MPRISVYNPSEEHVLCYIEDKLNLKDLEMETKKCLRWIRSNRPSGHRLEQWEEDEVIEIEGYTMARLQYPAIHDTTKVISEVIRSTESYQYHKNRDRTAPRHDSVLIRWEKEEGENTMSNRRVGRVFLLFSVKCNVTGNKIGMAYVEWLKVPTRTWDKTTEMFKVKRSQNYMVIDIGAIERGCHLVPCFDGFETTMAGIPNFNPSLDIYTHFWINNWIDEHMYQTIYADADKWK